MISGNLIVSFPATETGVKPQDTVGASIIIVVSADEASGQTGEEFLKTTGGEGFLEEEARISVDVGRVAAVSDVGETCSELVFGEFAGENVLPWIAGVENTRRSIRFIRRRVSVVHLPVEVVSVECSLRSVLIPVSRDVSSSSSFVSPVLPLFIII